MFMHGFILSRYDGEFLKGLYHGEGEILLCGGHHYKVEFFCKQASELYTKLDSNLSLKEIYSVT